MKKSDSNQPPLATTSILGQASSANSKISESSSHLQKRSLDAVWHPCTQMKQHEKLPLIPIVRGTGAWLFDANGKSYLDAISSWWTNLFGHTNLRINTAICDQLTKIEHVMLAGFTHEPVVTLSERLNKLTHGKLGHCFYASDGASAVEIALKMSFHFWVNNNQPKKSNFICLQNDYHGETLGALSVTDVAIFKETYAPLLRISATVPSPDWRLCAPDETPKEYALRAVAVLKKHLEQHHMKIAALIVEPLVQGAMGMGMYHPEYLKRAKELCNQYQIHLIADEIAVGFGRTGTMFACEQAHVVADFLCLSKGLSGGYLPLSVVMTNDTIYHAFYHDEASYAFLHSHTHTGNALACRAAIATLDIFEDDQIITANQLKTDYLNHIAQPLSSHPKVKNFRNCGMIWAFEVKTSDPNFSANFFLAGLKQQLVLRPIGNTVYFMPPYIISEQEMDFLVNGTLQVLNAL